MTKIKSKLMRLSVHYGRLLENLKSRIRTAQIKASLSVNRELIILYWDIGKSIVKQQCKEGWGKAVVTRLSRDLQRAFPGIAGFSSQNIWKMRSFYMAWTEEVVKLSQPVRELDGENLPVLMTNIPWGHNIELISKIKDPRARLWYAQQTVVQGWSRASLTHWIDSHLYLRQGRAVTNFKTALPATQSDFAIEIMRDPYQFSFLALNRDASERELETGLLNHIRNFLLELGSGFAFVGQQVPIAVDHEDFYIDLLFYHLRLRCYVVIDLKVKGFRPEYAGKMNFYLSAVDDLLRHPEDKPSIGMILCKTRSRIIAEYALRHIERPVGVARYETKLVERLPKELKNQLPSIQQIQAEISGITKIKNYRGKK